VYDSRRSGTSSTIVSRPVTRLLRRTRTAPTPSGSLSPWRSSSKASIGDQDGRLAPSRSSA